MPSKSLPVALEYLMESCGSMPALPGGTAMGTVDISGVSGGRFGASGAVTTAPSAKISEGASA